MTSSAARSTPAEPAAGAAPLRGRRPLRGLARRLIRQRPAALVTVLALLIAGPVFGLIYWAANDQDEIATRRSQQLVQGLLADRMAEIGRTAADLARQDAARGPADPDVSAAVTVPAAGAPEVAYIAARTSPGAALAGRIDPQLGQLVAAARSRGAAGPAFEAGLLAIGGRPHIAGAAAVTAATAGPPTAAEARPVLVLLQAIDEDFLDSLAPGHAIGGLRYVTGGTHPGAGWASHELEAFDGAPLGRLAWQVERPGRHLLGRVLPPLGLAFLLLAGLALAITRTLRNTSTNLKASLTLLARRNAELTRSQQDTAQLQTRLQTALEYSPGATAFFDADGNLIICNERFRRLMHPAYRHQVAVGEDFGQLCASYVKAWFGRDETGVGRRWLAQGRAFWRGGDSSMEIGMACGRWMLLRRRMTSDGGFVLLLTDITELHGRQQNLSALSSRLQVTLDSLREGVAVFDPDQRLAAVQPALCGDHRPAYGGPAPGHAHRQPRPLGLRLPCLHGAWRDLPGSQPGRGRAAAGRRVLVRRLAHRRPQASHDAGRIARPHLPRRHGAAAQRAGAACGDERSGACQPLENRVPRQHQP